MAHVSMERKDYWEKGLSFHARPLMDGDLVVALDLESGEEDVMGQMTFIELCLNQSEVDAIIDAVGNRLVSRSRKKG